VNIVDSSSDADEREHQQKSTPLVSTYKNIYNDKIILNIKFQADKYISLQATKKLQNTARNMNFMVHAEVCKGCMNC
jgi:hypothetical protein